MPKIGATDIGDEQWDLLAPQKRRGPKSRVDMRDVINTIFDRLPTALVAKRTSVLTNGRRILATLEPEPQIEKINTKLREAARIKAGKNRHQPSLSSTASR